MSDDAPPRESSSRLPLAKVLGIAAAAGLVPLNSTMIAVALPTIADDFGVSTAAATTLITIYLIVMLVGQPIAGRITDAIGARRSVVGALVGLALFSVLAAVATSFSMLVVARALQAVCAATISPGAQSLLRAISTPEQQGRVFGILGSVLGTGAALGPVVGGLLVQLFGWEAIFVINVPVALLAAVAAVAGRGAAAQSAERGRAADHAGRILNRVFVAGFSAQALSTQAQYALLLLTPVILDARGWGAGWIGVELSALTLGMIVMGPIGGRVGDERGRRLPSTVGLMVATGATVVLFVFGPSVAAGVLGIGLAVFGVGLGATTPNLMSAALGSVPPAQTGAAAGILSTSRYVGSIGTSLLIAAVVTADAAGTRVVLGVSAVCLALAVLVSRWLPNRAPGSVSPDPPVTDERAR